jgi:hypothetical protein
MQPKLSNRKERGSAFVEFVLCFSLFWIPLFFGVWIIGFSTIRAMQVTQVCRDAAHMYAYGTDFSQAAYQTMLVNMAPGLSLNTNGTGNGVVVLSTITYVTQNDCTAANITASNCTNANQTVFTRRIVIGNSAVHSSTFGTPSSSIIDSTGSISAANYLTNTSARATSFPTITNIQLTSGQFAYVAEMWVNSPDLNFWGGLSNPVSGARFIF